MKKNIVIFFVLILLTSGFLTGCHHPEPEPDVTIIRLSTVSLQEPNPNTNLQENILYRIDSLGQLQDLIMYGMRMSDMDFFTDIDFNEHTLLFFRTSWGRHLLDVSWEKMDDNNYNFHAELWETAVATSYQIFYVCMTNRKLKNNELVSFSITQHDIPYEE